MIMFQYETTNLQGLKVKKLLTCHVKNKTVISKINIKIKINNWSFKIIFILNYYLLINHNSLTYT